LSIHSPVFAALKPLPLQVLKTFWNKQILLLSLVSMLPFSTGKERKALYIGI
jgi:hypothetical protein